MTSREARYIITHLSTSQRAELLEQIQLKKFIRGKLFGKDIVDHRLYLFIVAELKGEEPELLEPKPIRHKAEKMGSRYLLPGQVLGGTV